jgi:hypothetical protein
MRCCSDSWNLKSFILPWNLIAALEAIANGIGVNLINCYAKKSCGNFGSAGCTLTKETCFQ